MTPFLSLLISRKDEPLEECRMLRYLERQTNDLSEIEIVLGCSTFSTQELDLTSLPKVCAHTKQVFERHPFISSNEASHIVALNNATGKYVSFLDLDDELFDEDSLSNILISLKQNPEGLVFRYLSHMIWLTDENSAPYPLNDDNPWTSYLWELVIDRNFLNKNKLKPNPYLKSHGDSPFVWNILCCLKREDRLQLPYFVNCRDINGYYYLWNGHSEATRAGKDPYFLVDEFGFYRTLEPQAPQMAKNSYYVSYDCTLIYNSMDGVLQYYTPIYRTIRSQLDYVVSHHGLLPDFAKQILYKLSILIDITSVPSEDYLESLMTRFNDQYEVDFQDIIFIFLQGESQIEFDTRRFPNLKNKILSVNKDEFMQDDTFLSLIPSYHYVLIHHPFLPHTGYTLKEWMRFLPFLEEPNEGLIVDNDTQITIKRINQKG